MRFSLRSSSPILTAIWSLEGHPRPNAPRLPVLVPSGQVGLYIHARRDRRRHAASHDRSRPANRAPPQPATDPQALLPPPGLDPGGDVPPLARETRLPGEVRVG